mmetsp:Transcript_1621/g.5378  ORF Transcript_1621/g.5378 Transcript_1621/m.5378 type:complete len:408 (-) Transcript_1621:40-1263(-)
MRHADVHRHLGSEPRSFPGLGTNHTHPVHRFHQLNAGHVSQHLGRKLGRDARLRPLDHGHERLDRPLPVGHRNKIQRLFQRIDDSVRLQIIQRLRDVPVQLGRQPTAAILLHDAKRLLQPRIPERHGTALERRLGEPTVGKRRREGNVLLVIPQRPLCGRLEVPRGDVLHLFGHLDDHLVVPQLIQQRHRPREEHRLHRHVRVDQRDPATHAPKCLPGRKQQLLLAQLGDRRVARVEPLMKQIIVRGIDNRIQVQIPAPQTKHGSVVERHHHAHLLLTIRPGHIQTHDALIVPGRTIRRRRLEHAHAGTRLVRRRAPRKAREASPARNRASRISSERRAGRRQPARHMRPKSSSSRHTLSYAILRIESTGDRRQPTHKRSGNLEFHANFWTDTRAVANPAMTRSEYC